LPKSYIVGDVGILPTVRSQVYPQALRGCAVAFACGKMSQCCTPRHDKSTAVEPTRDGQRLIEDIK